MVLLIPKRKTKKIKKTFDNFYFLNRILKLIFYNLVIYNLNILNQFILHMEKIVLKSEKREASESTKTLRASKIIPAVVYGHKQKATSIKLNSSDILRAYRLAWKNHVIELDIDGEKMDVLFHEVQKAPISGDFLHIDFYAITKGEKVHTHIPLNFIWTSKAKTDEWAIIEELVRQLEVKCLPTDLIDSIEVDLSLLEKTWDNIKVSQLKVSSKIEILTPQDEVIVLAAKPKTEKIEDTAPVMELPTDPKEGKTEEKATE